MATSASLEEPQPPRRSPWLFRLLDALLILLALFVAAGAYFYWQGWRTEPRRDGTLAVAGLGAPATIVRDRRGIAHITAASLHDVYYAEGYAMAQDRLWQMDMMRRLAEGTLAEVFGPVGLATDEQTRTLGLDRIAARETAALAPAARDLLDAFAAGVNQFIAERRGRLPLEFRLLHYQPAPWRPLDSLAFAAQMYRSLSTSYKDELEREAILAAAGPQAAAALFPDRSPWDIPPGAWPAPTAPAALARRRAPAALGWPPAAAPFAAAGSSRERGAPPPPRAGRLAPLLAALAAAPESSANLGRGSNNWVLASSRTATGAPILANDPHLEYQQPGIWWAVELRAPGLHVIGVTFPGTPGVIIGHNDHIAWGMTNVGADVQDLYREPPAAIHVLGETIPVKGRAPVAFPVRLAPRGPIVAEDAQAALALDWSLYHPGSLKPAIGRRSKPRSPIFPARRKTSSMPTPPATSATNAPAAFPSAAAGTARCPCPTIPPTAGPAGFPSAPCRACTTPPPACSPPPTAASRPTATRTSSPITGTRRTAPAASTNGSPRGRAGAPAKWRRFRPIPCRCSSFSSAAPRWPPPAGPRPPPSCRPPPARRSSCCGASTATCAATRSRPPSPTACAMSSCRACSTPSSVPRSPRAMFGANRASSSKSCWRRGPPPGCPRATLTGTTSCSLASPAPPPAPTRGAITRFCAWITPSIPTCRSSPPTPISARWKLTAIITPSSKRRARSAPACASSPTSPIGTIRPSPSPPARTASPSAGIIATSSRRTCAGSRCRCGFPPPPCAPTRRIASRSSRHAARAETRNRRSERRGRATPRAAPAAACRAPEARTAVRFAPPAGALKRARW